MTIFTVTNKRTPNLHSLFYFLFVVTQEMIKNFSNKIEQGQMVVEQMWFFVQIVHHILIGVQFIPDRSCGGGKVDLSSGSTQIAQL